MGKTKWAGVELGRPSPKVDAWGQGQGQASSAGGPSQSQKRGAAWQEAQKNLGRARATAGPTAECG